MIYKCNHELQFMVKATFFAKPLDTAQSLAVYLMFGHDTATDSDKLILAFVEELADGKRCIVDYSSIDYSDFVTGNGRYPPGIALMTGDDHYQAYAIHQKGADWTIQIMDSNQFGLLVSTTERIQIPFTEEY